MRSGMPVLFAAGVLSAAFGTPAVARADVVVEEIAKGSAGEAAGIQVGDVVRGWRREATPANPRPAKGRIRWPFELADVAMEQAPRGPLQLELVRNRRRLSLRMPIGEWRLRTRPSLPAWALELHRKAPSADAPEKAAELWREAAETALARRERALASWLLWRLGEFHAEQRRPTEALDAYGRARAVASDGQRAIALALLWEAAGTLLLGREDLAAAEAAYHEALRLRTQARPDSLAVAASLQNLGVVAWRREDSARAVELHTQALRIRQRLAPDSMELALSFGNLGVVAKTRGDIDTAEGRYREAMAIHQKLMPGGRLVALGFNNLGVIAFERGQLREADQLHCQALEIREKLSPGGRDVAASLLNLGAVAKDRGDLVAAEDLYRRALEILQRLQPDSTTVGACLSNLGTVASQRGDWALAEENYEKALRIYERVAPESMPAATALNNLGVVAKERGELERAQGYFERSLTMRQRVAPDGLEVSESLINLGGAALERHDLAAARTHYERALSIARRLAPDGVYLGATLASLGRVALDGEDLVAAEASGREALAIRERLAPGGLDVASSVQLLGEILARRGDRAGAEALYQRALETRSRLAPGSADEAESLHALGSLRRQLGEVDQARELLCRAVEALEAQRGRLGGGAEARTAFGAKFQGYYRDCLQALLEEGRSAEAFGVLERSRARSLLAMLAERDLVFTADAPAELGRERKESEAEYDRTQAQIAALDPSQQAAELERLLARLRELRERRQTLAQRIRKASPRLAALQYPEPLDLAGVRAVLDPGSVLLAYSVATNETSLFVVRSASDTSRQGPEFAAFRLPIGEKELRRRVAAFRSLCQRKVASVPETLLAQGRSLFQTLLAPAVEMIRGAQRLVVSPDGPLHTLPFAALVHQPAARSRGSLFLAEWKPLHLVVSATVYAELKKPRDEAAPARPTALAAFGDPRYPGLAQGERDKIADATLRLALSRGYSFEPLPSSREEVDAIAGLFPDGLAKYLGPDATEDRAKALGKDVRYVHFACHGILDERFPLDSALALSAPEKPEASGDNGLLQAWEVFEKVRLDADLVTLSGCETALGQEAGGEGLVGLTRAFEYAGARSVLASLWNVSDESTAELMQRFYGQLKAGLSKDEALRSAQAELIGRRAARVSHPFHWAAFQLIGDWK